MFSPEPSHVGLFPLQFSQANKMAEPVFASLTHFQGGPGGQGGYEERPRQRRSERKAVEEYGGRRGEGETIRSCFANPER